MRKSPARTAEEKRDHAKAIEAAARIRLGITSHQWRTLKPLIEREAVAYESLAILVYGDRPPDDPKLGIAQHIFELRARLKRHGVTITNLRDFGYAIAASHRRTLIQLLGAADEISSS